MKAKDRKKIILLSIVAATLAAALSSAAIQYLDLDPWMLSSYWKIFTAVIISFSLCILFFNNKKIAAGAGIAAVAAALIFLVLWFRGNLSEEFMEAFSGYFIWLRKFIFSWEENMTILPPYATATTIAISALISAFLYLFVVKWFFFPAVLVLTAGIFSAQWAVAREVQKTSFYLSAGIITLLYFIGVYIRKDRIIAKSGEKNRLLNISGFAAAAAPVIAVILILAVIIPKSPDPIEWKWLDDRIKYRDRGGDKPIDYKSYESFSLAATGFSSEAGRLGGAVTLDMSHMLDVYSSEPLYLRGESWPYFDGSAWGTVSGENNYAELLLDYNDFDAERQMLIENAYGWRFIDLYEWISEGLDDSPGVTVLPGVDFNSVMGEHLLPSWYTKKKVDINYAGVETKTLFTPLYSNLTNYDDLKPVYAETDGTFDSDKTIKLFTVLRYDYLSLDRKDEQFLETIRKSRQGIYEDLLSRLYFISYNADEYENIRITNSMDSTLRDLYELSQKAELINWRYTALPENLPQRVVDLAFEITEGLETDYDRVAAIEDYLSDEYTYNLSVADVPIGRNFTDWFLFETREGYCTYYATAMATLVRSLGLPARYVEGFATQSRPTDSNRFAVLNSNAHAWVEVYFEGIGWISFEPTSPYNLILESTLTGDSDQGETLLDDPAFNPYLNEPDKEDFSGLIDNPDNPGLNDQDGISFAAIILIAAGAYLLLNLVIYISRLIFFRHIRKRSTFKKAYSILLRMLSVKGIRIKDGATLAEHAQRIDETFYMGKVSMKDLTKTYYRILYSEEEVNSDEFHRMSEFFKDFRREMDSELRLWELILYRILLPLI